MLKICYYIRRIYNRREQLKMSCMERKTTLRMEIPSLQGKDYTEAFEYFRNILGEPEELDLDEETGEVYYFSYEGKFQPVYDYSNKKWGADLILYHSSDYKVYVSSDYERGVTLKEFNMLADELVGKFGGNKEDIKLLSYEWYNGGDEPVRF
jgi:hypothetical protein